MKLNMMSARVNANLTREQMGEKLGVTSATIANWEKGKSLPNIKQAMEFAVACCLLLEDIDFLRPCSPLKYDKEVRT